MTTPNRPLAPNAQVAPLTAIDRRKRPRLPNPTLAEQREIRRRTVEANTPLWMLVVAQMRALYPHGIEFKTWQIVELLSPMQAHQVLYHARQVHPGHYNLNGQYDLTFEEWVPVIYRCCEQGNASNLPDPVELRKQLLAEGRIIATFPDAVPVIATALETILAHRKERANAERAKRAHAN